MKKTSGRGRGHCGSRPGARGVDLGLQVKVELVGNGKATIDKIEKDKVQVEVGLEGCEVAASRERKDSRGNGCRLKESKEGKRVQAQRENKEGRAKEVVQWCWRSTRGERKRMDLLDRFLCAERKMEKNKCHSG